MGNISVKQHNSRQNKTKRNKQTNNNNTKYKKNRKRRGGQGSPLNPNSIKDSIKDTNASPTKKRRVKRDNKSLHLLLQKHKGRTAYLKELRKKQFAEARNNSKSGSTSTLKRKSF